MSDNIIDVDASIESMYALTLSENKIINTKDRIMGTDAGNLFDPFFYYTEAMAADTDSSHNPMMTIENNMDKRLLWATSTRSPQGHFVCFVTAIDAFRNEWKYIERKGYEEVAEDILITLLELKKKYNIKQIHTVASGTARALGKCIVAKVKQTSHGYKKKPEIRFRVFPVFDWEIEWDDKTGEPKMYHPMATIGLMWHRFDIPAEDAILYVHKMDPFGNGFQGIPETYVMYNQLKWLANIEKGWAEAMDTRGISMLQFKIPGFHRDQLQTWKDIYGDPTSYHVAFTDDDIDIQGIPGVQSSFDMDNTMTAFTKETAAGSGIASSRIDGTQRGQVTGSATDTDNYYSILSTIQEEFESQLIELHEILDPSLIDTFDISWDVEPKTDKFSKAQIRSANMSTLMSGLDFYTYNQGLELLDLPKVGEEGDEKASVYIFNMQQAAGMVMSPQEQMEINEGSEPTPEGEFKSKKNAADGKPTVRAKQPTKPPKDDDQENRGGDRESHIQQCKAHLASGRRCLRFTANPSGYCYLHEGGKRGGKWGSEEYQHEAERKGKLMVARRLRESGDSYSIIRKKLKDEFGSALSNTTLKEVDGKITSDRQECISRKIRIFEKEHPDWSHKKCVAAAINYCRKKGEGHGESSEKESSDSD